MKKLIFIKIIFLFLTMSCQGNLFYGISSKTNTADYIFEAQKYLDGGQYDLAINVIESKISPSDQTRVDVREILASSYGGKCGLNFINYTQKLSAQTTGSSLYILMSPFVGVVVQPQFCRKALDTMTLIGGTPSARTLNQNTFTAILGMVLMGTALRGYADIAPALGDGVADVDICVGLTNTQIDDVVLGFGFMAENFVSMSATLIGGASITALNNMIASCSSVAGSSCQITNPANITVPVRDTVRDLIKTIEYGIGTYSTGGNNLLIPMACP